MRASQAPEQWQLVLDAINRDDYVLANQLAVKYGFTIQPKDKKGYSNVRHEPKKGDYVAMSPDGKMYCHESAIALSKHLGMSDSYIGSVATRTRQSGRFIEKGKMKGWQLWRE